MSSPGGDDHSPGVTPPVEGGKAGRSLHVQPCITKFRKPIVRQCAFCLGVRAISEICHCTVLRTVTLGGPGVVWIDRGGPGCQNHILHVQLGSNMYVGVRDADKATFEPRPDPPWPPPGGNVPVGTRVSIPRCRRCLRRHDRAKKLLSGEAVPGLNDESSEEDTQLAGYE